MHMNLHSFMCNHNRRSQNMHAGAVGGDLKIKAGIDIKADDEITMCHEGNMHGNDRFYSLRALNQGFE